MFKFLRIFKDVNIPRKVNGYFEFFSREDVVIPPHNISLIHTGIRLEFPAQYFGYINCHSPTKRALGGVVDSDYRGELKVMIFNNSFHPITIKKNEVCAYMHFFELSQAEIIEVCS